MQEQVCELNRRAVEAFLNQKPHVEALCQQVLALAAPDGFDVPLDPAGAAEALRTLGRYCMSRSDNGRALEFFQKSLRLFEQSGIGKEIALTRSYLGVAFCGLGDYPRAAELLRQSLREAEEQQDPVLSAEVLNDLSYTYVMAGEPDMALRHLKRAIQTFREREEYLRLCWTLESIGRAYLLIGCQDEALRCVLEAVDLADRLKARIDMVRMRLSAGEMYRALGNFIAAQMVFEEVLALARETGMRGEECSALLSIAELHLLKSSPEPALALLEEAETIAVQTGIKPFLRRCCQLLSRAKKALGDFPSALEYHERFYEVDKEIFNTETDQRLRNVQALYQLETARKETELYQLRAQALQQEVDERRRTAAILEKAASTDPLTDLLNRRAFFDLAEKAFHESRCAGLHLSIILIDVDHFKEVNDRYGHLVGDRALALIAERLRDQLRADDAIARYGGEEFIVLLPGVSRTGAVHLAERLRLAVASLPIQARGVSVPVTLSLGVTSMHPDMPAESLDQLIAQADTALYAAKDQGRNAAVSFDEAPACL